MHKLSLILHLDISGIFLRQTATELGMNRKTTSLIVHKNYTLDS